MDEQGAAIYGSRWQKASRRYLEANPLCVMCQRMGHVHLAQAVDHVVPHRLKAALASGDPVAIAKARRLFWDPSNWAGLCERHHNSTKQRIEKRGYEIGATEDGLPLDPSHPWNNPAR